MFLFLYGFLAILVGNATGSALVGFLVALGVYAVHAAVAGE